MGKVTEACRGADGQTSQITTAHCVDQHDKQVELGSKLSPTQRMQSAIIPREFHRLILLRQDSSQLLSCKDQILVKSFKSNLKMLFLLTSNGFMSHLAAGLCTLGCVSTL